MNFDSKMAQAGMGIRPAHTVFRGGQIVNVFTGEVYRADVAVENGMIVGIGSYAGEHVVDISGKILCPGFLDAHLHLESTLVTPSELVENAVKCGTTTYIVDPHESANVSGAAGIDYILEETEEVPANVYVMMPSCVPALPFEDNGCTFTAEEMKQYRNHPRVLGLGEVMDHISVIQAEPSMLEKLELFSDQVCDGHIMTTDEKQLSTYLAAGVRTNHECTTYAEAKQQCRLGMHIHVRQGSAARNLDALVSGLVAEGIDTSAWSFCTDDKHIEDIRREGHIDHCVRRAVELGMKPVDAIRMATYNTAQCYGLKQLGAVAPGYWADLVALDGLDTLNVCAVYYHGKNVADFHAQPKLPADSPLRSSIHCAPVALEDFAYPVSDESRVIELIPGQLVTNDITAQLPQENGFFAPDETYSKLAVIERHRASGKMGVAAVRGFGIRGGAVASSVAHDSHNLSVIGDNDADMLLAVQELQRTGGGYTVVSGGKVLHTVPLPIMGLMSDAGFSEVQDTLAAMLEDVHRLGVPDNIEPFILLSFLALPVIPTLRLTPRGLFDVTRMEFVEKQN